jgi:hypothetical protein
MNQFSENTQKYSTKLYSPTIVSIVHSPNQLNTINIFSFLSYITHNLHFEKDYLNEIVIVDR